MKCSLAPVCLPEEARLASMLSELPPGTSEVRQLKLVPADHDRCTLHVLSHGARIGRKGDRLEVSVTGEPPRLYQACCSSWKVSEEFVRIPMMPNDKNQTQNGVESW